jgi:hypothetical protein
MVMKDIIIHSRGIFWQPAKYSKMINDSTASRPHWKNNTNTPVFCFFVGYDFSFVSSSLCCALCLCEEVTDVNSVGHHLGYRDMSELRPIPV